jgi:hypothetical protein
MILDEHGHPISPETITIHKAGDEAIRVFETIDGYAAVQRDIGIRVHAEFERVGKLLPRPLVPNEERLKYELTILDINAEEYLKLVSDLKTQKCYLSLLLELASDVWDRYRGMAPLNAFEDNPIVQKIDTHRNRWAIAGWDKIAKPTCASGAPDGDAGLIASVKELTAIIGVKEFLALCGMSKQSYYRLVQGNAKNAIKAKARKGIEESQKSHKKV